MANLFFANGDERVSDDYPRFKAMPIFLDDSHKVIEAPSLWARSVAKKGSRSKATLEQYSSIMQRYLRWLDDRGYMAQSWMMVDEDIFSEYIEFLCETEPQADSVAFYCARISAFYRWATRKGYDNFFDIGREDIENTVKVNLSDQRLLAHVNPMFEVTKLGFETPSGRPTFHEAEVRKFVTDGNQRVALELLDDIVYRIISTVIRITGLRPRDLFQLPYRGTGPNAGFIPYDYDEIPEDCDIKEIYFQFRSKGKNRSIQFPGVLWRAICEFYIPIRRERAQLYFEKHGMNPRNDQLFLSEDGDVVTPYMLRYNFAKVVKKSENLGASGVTNRYIGRKYTPRMLRHSCATYFVYEHLRKNDQLGKGYRYDPVVDEKLRKMLGHEDVETTYKYYVHLVSRFHSEDLIFDLKKSHVDLGLNTLLEAMGV